MSKQDRINDLISKLSDEEKAVALKIFRELREGQQSTLNALYEKDFEEIPVDIETFITDDRYIGKFTENGKAIYDYWKKEMDDIFDEEGRYQEIALTGSIGIGKSTIACIMMAYCLYKIMCLKNPQAYYRLTSGATIIFAFLNNTLDLTESVGYGTIQNIVQESPWFMERGVVSGTKHKEYIPNKLIRFKIGSSASHVLGANVFCLLGDTLIETTKGTFKIEDLENQEIQVYSIDDNGNKCISEICTVKETARTDMLYEIELENGSIIRCTENHRFMLKDGTYKEAKDLTVNDDLFEGDL